MSAYVRNINSSRSGVPYQTQLYNIRQIHRGHYITGVNISAILSSPEAILSLVQKLS